MWNSKVIWSEGMFLQPHHFQQQERYLHNVIEQRTQHLRPFSWGFSELKLDQQALALGEIAISSARGVLEDGTPFCIPEDCAPPPSIAVPADAKNAVVVLTLPVRRREMDEVDAQDSPDSLARWSSGEYSVRDSNLGQEENYAPMEVGKLRLRLNLESAVTGGYARLGVVRVLERRPDNSLVLDEDYMPPCLGYHACARLSKFVRELLSLLHQRGEALAKQVLGVRGGAVAEIADFLLLQVINRYEPLLAHIAEVRQLHPEALYQTCVMLAGDLATYSRETKRPREFPAYRHADLWATFAPLIEDLRRSLSLVIERNAIEVPIEQLKHVRIARVPDRNLVRDATLVLAVNAQMPANAVRERFPAQSKIGPVERIKELVANNISGIQLDPLQVAPRQIPFHKGYVYFEFDRKTQGELWRMVETSPDVAIHVAGEFPGLEMECWAIRE